MDSLNINTLQEAIIHFSDFENCKTLMMQLRWPDGVVETYRDIPGGSRLAIQEGKGLVGPRS